jgi:Uma2 family endonuclease
MAYFMTSVMRQRPMALVPPLENGDYLDQPTFHERYESMEEDVRAELIGGIVYMSSPVGIAHGKTTQLVGVWLDGYELTTPGTEVLSDISNIMGPQSEPEPDHCMRLLPEAGGQTTVNRKGYLVGAPELIVETASSTESRDLHQKKADYEKAGVLEYVVVALRSEQVYWFMLKDGRFEDLKPGRDGIFCSQVFPGLWLDPGALLKSDRKKLLAVLKRGLASKEHRAFVGTLKAKKGKDAGWRGGHG